ncbi:FAD dependent oxidoreductase [Bisporella sp. PMI_857]|nr:FAD dependent oxidoreductase [Bisporella sp. PMI_857]
MTVIDLKDGQAGLPVENSSKSYWHSQPSEKLIGHRTTADLPSSADVVIVGSGISGAIAAHTLREKRSDLNIVMLEAREACWGATGRNGGHCQPAIYAAASPNISHFELQTYLYLKELVETHSIPCDWKTTTSVHAYYSASLFANAQATVERLKESYPDLAVKDAVITKESGGRLPWATADKNVTLEDLRAPNADGAIVQLHAASLWPYKLVAFVLERLLATSGATNGDFNLHTTTPVVSLQKLEARSTNSNEGQPAWIVHTPRGQIAAKHVLLATNAYTSYLLPQFSDLIVPIRGQVSALKPPQEPTLDEAPLDIEHTYYIVGETSHNPLHRDDYLIQRPAPDAELILGGGRQFAKGLAVGVWDDSTVEEPVGTWLKESLPQALNLSLRNEGEKASRQTLDATYEWTGIMGYSRDAHPWVGEVPVSLGGGDGLHIAAGYTGHGMPNAALCGKAAADLILGVEKVDIPPEYVLSEERVKAARLRDTVAVAEEKGSLIFTLNSW